MIRLKPDLSTKENREYWAFVRKTREEVMRWPEWKRPRVCRMFLIAGCKPVGHSTM